MPKGGARVRSGPPPDPNALSRDSSDWVILPAAGRVGDAPVWPLPDADRRELELWDQLWALPQAAMWQQLRLDIEVGLYVRRLVQVEQRDSPASVGTLVRQMADNLGLTVPGMLRNRWRLGDIEQPKPQEKTAKPAPRSARDRLRVVPDGA